MGKCDRLTNSILFQDGRYYMKVPRAVRRQAHCQVDDSNQGFIQQSDVFMKDRLRSLAVFV